MTSSQWTEVDRYLSDLLVGPDAALAASDAAGLPSINVSPNQGKLLMLLARLQGARRILEIGTLGGYSTIWLARGLAEGGSLISLESEARHAEVARSNIARAGLAGRIEVLVGKAIDTLPLLQGPFDMVFIDADKSSTREYLEWSLKLSRPGTLIVLDNVVRNGGVADPASRDASVKGVRRGLEWLSKQPGVSATAMQTVGEKGYDGFALLLVNKP